MLSYLPKRKKKLHKNVNLVDTENVLQKPKINAKPKKEKIVQQQDVANLNLTKNLISGKELEHHAKKTQNVLLKKKNANGEKLEIIVSLETVVLLL